MKKLILIFTILLFAVQAFCATATFQWDEVKCATKYRIFERTADTDYNYQTPVWEGVNNTATISGLDINGLYFYVVRSVNSHGNESSDSGEILADIQAGVCESETKPSAPGGCMITAIRK